MTTDRRLIILMWLVFVLYWAVSAASAKRSAGRRAWWRGPALRLGILFIGLYLQHIPVVKHALRHAQSYLNSSVLMGHIGVLLSAVGFGLAIYARVTIGRNWGMPMTRKENPELVTNGPYARIRHPIYTGILLAMLGTTIGVTIFWALPLVLFGVYFIFSARREEKLMIEQFPQQYPAYMQRTKMLVPFVL
jgi:protein-S-isoprenylcysteine O-methyltransferase Ste14